MSAPKSHTTVVAPRSHAPLPPPVPHSPDTPVRRWRQLLAVLSLVGLIASVMVGFLAFTSPAIFPPITEHAATRRGLPPELMILPGGFVLIGLAMIFLMPSPWYGLSSTLFGMRRRRQNWALLAGSLAGALAAGGCGAALASRQVQAPVAVERDGHYVLRQNFQTIREISAEEYVEAQNAGKLFTIKLFYLPTSLFNMCVYLSALLYALWYLHADPQVNWRDGFLDEMIR